MAIVRVPFDYPTIAAAMPHVAPSDTLQLDPGYSGESAVVSVSGLTITGDATNLGIQLALAAGVTAVTAQALNGVTIVDDAAGINSANIQSYSNNTLVSVSGGNDYVREGGVGTRTLSVNYGLATNGITTTYFSADGGYYGQYTDGTNNYTVSFGGPETFIVTTGSGADSIVTGDFDDTVSLGAGNDTVEAGGGNDSVDGGAGDDRIITVFSTDGADTYSGGAGSDTLDYSRLLIGDDLSVTLAGAATTTVSIAFADNDQISGVENITSGGGNDAVTGDANANALIGGDGNDSLAGKGGADTLDGGLGNDFLYIDHLDASVSGAAGYDSAFIQDATGTSLNLGAAQVEWVYGWTGNDTLDASTSSAGVSIVGEAGADSITGSAFNDYIYMDGQDTVDAGGGRDALVVYQGAGQPVTNTTVNVAAAQAEWVLGGAGNDTIFNTGSSTAATLSGGAGNDTITGGLANDRLYGNAGNDVFVVSSNTQRDFVLDFQNGADRVDVRATSFTNFAQVQAAAADNGFGSTVINFGAGNYMVLYNFAIGGLDASDFIF